MQYRYHVTLRSRGIRSESGISPYPKSGKMVQPQLPEMKAELPSKKPKSKKPSGEKKSPIDAPISLYNPKSARFHFVCLLFAAFFANTLARVTFSVGVVCMINASVYRRSENQTNATDANFTRTEAPPGICNKAETEEDHQYSGPLTWDSYQQGIAQSAINWGGLFSVLPVVCLAEKFSPKRIVAACLCASVVGCLLTPIVAVKLDLIGVFALRFLMGVGGQAVINPVAIFMTAKWIPPNQRTTVISMCTNGIQIAIIFSMPLNAHLCQQPQILGGWPGIFYFTGLMIVPILVLWVVFAADTPRQYKWIRRDELNYIKESLADQGLKKKPIEMSKVPWKQICFSGPVQATFIGSGAATAVMTIFQTYLPSYFKQSLNLNLKKNGFFCALPFIAQIVGKTVCSPLADYMRTHKTFGPTCTCKISNSIAMFGSAIFLIATAYMTCETAGAAIALSTTAYFFYGFTFGGFVTSLMVIAPVYSAVVNAWARFYGQIAAVVSPLLVGAMTRKGTTEEWRNVFWLMIASFLVAGAFFLVFGSGELQPWARKKNDEEEGTSSDSSLPLAA